MPNSTTLESLNIEVNGNAQKASEGIGTLIGSLRSLARGLGTAIPALKSINKELKTLSTYGHMKIPAIGMGITNGANKAVSDTRKVTRATQEQIDAIRKWQEERNAIRPRTFEYHRDNMVSAEEFARVQQQPKMYHVPSENTKRILENSIAGVKGYKETLVSLEHGAKSAIATTQQISTAMQTAATSSSTCTSALVGVDNELKAKKTDGKVAKQGLDEASRGMKDAGKAAEDGATRTHRFGQAIGRIGRIFSTMMIRTALRSLMKTFSESWAAAYNFSKKMGGEFAESIDKVKTLLSGTATNIISAFAPAIQALVPIITAVASAINYLCSLIRSLFSLLGMSSDLFGASADAINKYAGSASGGSKANKEMLASFDELNVISSAAGGGGGGGGGGSSFKFADLISTEFDAVTALLVDEGMIALGLILACTGHIGLGVGLIAIGAAGIVKTITEDWNKLPADVQATITKITAIAAVSFTALGIIALCSGHVGLGLGLLLAGGLNAYAALAPNWGTIVTAVKVTFDIIKSTLQRIWNSIKDTAQKAWDAVCKIWEDTGIGPLVRKAWGGLSTFFKGLWEDISAAAHGAWNVISKWWHENVTKNVEKEGIWGGVKGFFKGLWETVTRHADDAWNKIMVWWNTGIGPKVEAAWKAVKKWFADQWENIKKGAVAAWNIVKDWWDSGIGKWVSGVWEAVKTTLTDIWEAIKTPIKNAWNVASNWWNITIQPWVSAVWNSVKKTLGDIWDKIKKPIEDAWAIAKNWWENNIYSKIKAAWEGVKQIFQPLLDILKEIWNFIEKIAGKTIKTTIETTVKTVQSVSNMSKEGTTENNLVKIATSGLEEQGFFGKIASGVLGLFGFKAEGAYGIPAGDLFVANEAGAELIGSMNGKTTVANQEQIIEGIQRGVSEANEEQNALLRRQNELLLGILQKETNFNFGASAAFGRVARQSLDMYNNVAGV